MAQLRLEYDLFAARDTEIIAVGPENAKTFNPWWHEHEMPFVGIPDPKHRVADVYGQQADMVKPGRMPASLLIDKSGTIRYSHFGSSMGDIPENGQILSLIDGLYTEKTSG